jgi:hypothetical protein
MNLENIRYHIAVTLMVLGCSGLPAGVIVFGITKAIHIDEEHLNTAYLASYIILVLLGLRLYTPRMRGIL